MLSHNTLNCASEGCYAVITVHPDEEDRLRRTHETFYCPAGHSNYFAGKTKQQKRIEELEHQNESLRAMLDRSADREYAQHDALLDVVRGMQPDDEARGRFLDRVGQDLVEHLVGEHNATRRPVALLEAGPTESVSG